MNGSNRDVLLAQLGELNERSRTYGRQLWQVPFAYVAASGVVLAQLAEKRVPLGIALGVITLVGGCVLWHLRGVYQAARRSFDAIRAIETQLSLPDDATRWTPGHLWALITLTIIVTLASFAGAICILLLVVCKRAIGG